MLLPHRIALLPLAAVAIATTVSASTPTEGERNLRRALFAWSTADTLTALEQLEDVSTPSARARFLLAESYRRLGHPGGFLENVRLLDASDDPLGAWLELDARVEAPAAGTTTPRGDAATLWQADRLLRENRPGEALAVLRNVRTRTPLSLYLQSLALEADGRDARAVLSELADHEAVGPQAELVAAAALRRAVAAAESGEDPLPWLDRIVPTSRHAARAAHLRALHAAERGDVAQASSLLEDLLRATPHYDGWLDAAFTLGALHLEAERFEEALSVFEAMDGRWQEQQQRIEAAGEPDALGALWSAWSTTGSPALLPIDRAGLDKFREEAWQQALDLRETPRRPPPDELPLAPRPPTDPVLGWPTLDEQAELDEADRALEEANYERWRAWGRLLRVEQDLARRDRYLGGGAEDIEESRRTLAAATARLDSLLAGLDALVAQLHETTDAELIRIAQRTRRLLERAAIHHIASANLRHFYLDGPLGERLGRLPEGVPHPAQILEEEGRLMAMLEDFVQVFAERAPPLIARSLQEIWEPRLLNDAPGLARWARRQLDESLRLAHAVDSTRVALAEDPARQAAQAELAAAQDAVDARRAHRQTLRQEIARAVLDRTRIALALHREGIDYGLATASYEVAVASSDGETPSSVGQREAAIAHLERFIERHPESHALSQARFSLADLLLLQARDDFHVEMAAFLAAEKQGRTVPVPYLDVEPALALYRTILEEDPQFAHRDATLFHLGMILADAGDPQAEAVLAQLIDEHPDAPFVPRAHLRLGDTRFSAKDFAASARHFEAATRSEDPQVVAIALYKLGWSHFNVDGFEDAADAFRRLLDLYGDGLSIDAKVDLRAEAEDDLVHSLARAGGAPVFERYFDRIGERPYQQRVLQGMSHLMKRYSLYEEASEVDELFLRRYPTAPATLEAARRLVDSYERGFDESRAMRARLETASLFTPGSEWHTVNTSDSLRTAGEEFARTSYRTVALHQHRTARESKASADWSRSLSLYETLLAQWPADAEAPRFRYLAGECAQELKQYETALGHFTAAAASDTASFATDAAWQRVAVTDAWYESTRAGEADLGADSLATRLIDVGEQFGATHPADERVVELRWRAGNLAFAHGWYGQASTALEGFVARHRDDARAPKAAQLRAESEYRQDHFDRAGAAFEEASALAAAAGQDSLVATIAPLIPHCHYRHAESVASADTAGTAAAAPLFADVARRWPDFEHAPLAWYQAGLGYAAHDDAAAAVEAWDNLLTAYPQSEYAQDAHRQIAHTWEAAGESVAAARAYERYAKAYPQQEDAPDAMMKAADLLVATGDVDGGHALQDEYLQAYPQDVQTALDIRESRARRELDSLGDAPVSSLLAGSARSSELARYLELTEQHPDQAAGDVLAQVRFLEAEEAYASYERVRLTQPLPESIETKKQRLADVLQRYGSCAELAVTPWAQAAAYRVGEALVHFGDALLTSERPADLAGDDRLAYDEVLEEQSWEFFDRGEQAWTDLLRESAADDATREWIQRTRRELFPRVAQRFVHVPTVDYPVVEATAPAPAR